MDLGSFFLAWSAVPLVLSLTGYLLVAAGARDFRIGARTVYWLLFGMVMTAFIYLFYLFATDQFQYSYVASYSSSELANSWPHFYKISALWAGQQGTFLLWLLFGVALGFWVKAKAKENEGWVMFFYILGQTFLLVLTIISNPFEKLSVAPADGQGLNPLLQNYWMQIHPPIVFVGFAAACIPFAFAMASLATNRYGDWVKQTLPWTVFTVITLGLGIFLGGYWAYETLGWGGYWAWDPVENSSLIPWMVSVALVHGMVVERSRGTWRRTNMFLAITLFLLIIYGTFLTRSGVLADFSVHSFTDLGYNNILWASIAFMGVISYGLWVYRAVKMKVPSASGTEILSQEFTTFLSMVLLLPFTMIVLFWTSFPLITSIMSEIPLVSKISPTPAAIDTANYNMVGIIFSIIFCVILGFNALLGWKKTDPALIKRKIVLPLGISFIASVLFIIIGFSTIASFWSADGTGEISLKVIVMGVLYFLFFFTAVFALVTNIWMLIPRWKTGFRYTGGYITHIGFALMLIGIIFSSTFGKSQKVAVSLGDSKSALDYSVYFKAHEPTIPKEQRSYFELSRGNKTIQAHTDSKEMARGNQIQYVRTPYIHKYPLSDLYLSVENLTIPNADDIKPFNLAVGEEKNIYGTKIIFNGFDSDKNLKRLADYQPEVAEITKGNSTVIGGRSVKFINFEMSQHQDEGGTQIGAILEVKLDGKTKTVTPYYFLQASGQYSSPAADFPGGGKISLIQILADRGSVVLSYSRMSEIPDIELGALVTVISGADTALALPIFDSGNPHSSDSEAEVPDGTLRIVDINPRENHAQFIFDPESQPLLATVELSTKPMINLVWIGFLGIVAGAAVAFFRRMAERRK
ncbi:MAG: cytochrome c biogenesis protein CcsA [Candidatus Zixiibacteriota bacterium]|nr:MAG: cytochrome c biogenesis protein CcsA [candidate division Zixibacteria bacterium]